MTRQDDTVYTGVAIDETGVATDEEGNDLILKVEDLRAVGIDINANEEASYAIDTGPAADDWPAERTTEYLKAEMDTTDVSDAFVVIPRYLRVRVTEAAPNGETATIYIARATR
ncbi:hypothetical protein [Haloferax volcanii]|uniref:hypothetical protein n=1 Tax=Haloferax volcanii TaxID=2246 RepID=UPI00249A66B8|nr:hypothetical protein [Haloferax alexandrinus]WEL29842.1 hypothetical protein HBNXHx_1736 [Haloferax alexandrinus]